MPFLDVEPQEEKAGRFVPVAPAPEPLPMDAGPDPTLEGAPQMPSELQAEPEAAPPVATQVQPIPEHQPATAPQRIEDSIPPNAQPEHSPANLNAPDLPEGVIENLPGAMASFLTKDTYASQQAASTLTQVVDFAPAMVRGVRGNVIGAMDSVLGKEHSAELRLALATANVIPGFPIADDPLLDEWLDASGKLRQEKRRELTDAALAQGGKTGAVVSGVVDAVEQTLMNLAFFKLASVPYGGMTAGTSMAMRSLNVVKGALVRAGIMTATQQQKDLKGAAASFGIAAVYQSMPAVSGWVRGTVGAIAADIALNATLTTVINSGVVLGVTTIRDSARAQALEEDHPERAALYELMGYVNAYGSDIVFGAMNRSLRDPKTPPEVRKAIEQVQANAVRIPREGAPRPTVANPSEAAPTLKAPILDTPESVRAYVDSAPNLVEAITQVAKSDIDSGSGDRRGLFDGQEQKVYDRARLDYGTYLQRKGQMPPHTEVVNPTAPESIPTSPRVVYVAENAPPDLRKVGSNLSTLLETLPKSPVAIGSAKDVEAGKQSDHVLIAEKVQNILDEMGARAVPENAQNTPVKPSTPPTAITRPAGESPQGGTAAQAANGAPRIVGQIVTKSGRHPVYQRGDDFVVNTGDGTASVSVKSLVDGGTLGKAERDALALKGRVTFKPQESPVPVTVPTELQVQPRMDALAERIKTLTTQMRGAPEAQRPEIQKQIDAAKDEIRALARTPQPTTPVEATAPPEQATPYTVESGPSGRMELKYPNPDGTSPEAFDQRVDKAAQRFAPAIEAPHIRRELNRRGMANALNDFAREQGYNTQMAEGKDVTRRSLSAAQLELFMQKRGIELKGMEDNGAAADMIKAAYRATSPEDAQRLYNEMSIQKGRAVVIDVKKTAMGGEPLPDLRYRLTPEERQAATAMMPTRLQATPQGQNAIAKILDQIDFPLPTNPRDLDATMQIARKLAAQLVRNQNQDADGIYRSRVSMWNKAQFLENARYAFGDLATMTGNHRIWDDYRAVDLGNRESIRASEVLAGELFKQAGLVKTTLRGKEVADMSMRYWIAAHPEIGDAMKTVIGTAETSPDHVAARRVIDAIPDAETRGKVYALTESIINNQLQSVDAVNARRNQLYRFEANWNKRGKDGRTFGEKYIELRGLGGERTTTQERSFGVMDAKLKNWLPHRNVEVMDSDGNVKNEHQQVSADEMIALARLWQEGGDAALIPALTNQEGWIRKHYYMTDGEHEYAMLEAKTAEIPGFTEHISEARTPQTGAINNRSGMGVFKEGDLFASLYKHSHTLRVQANTFHAVNRLKVALEEAYGAGRLPDEIYDGAKTWLESAWGKYKRQPWQNRLLFQPAESLFWTTYALTAFPWYAARNVLDQGTQLGPMNTQFRVADVQRFYWQALIDRRNPESRVAKWYARRFAEHISNVESIFYEQNLMADPGSYTAAGRFAKLRMQRVQNFAAMLIGAPDQFNRSAGAFAYSAIDHHVNRFVQGKIDKADVFNDLKIFTMHLAQQRFLDNLFEQARGTPIESQQWEAFREQLTEMKVENINFSYRISGRSLAEQEPSVRPWMGVTTYLRGTLNQLMQNGFRPIWQAIDGRKGKADWFVDPAFRQGVAVVGKSVMTHAIASAIAGYVIGEKADPLKRAKPGQPDPTAPDYSLLHALTYTPMRPGATLAIEFLDNASQLFSKLMYSDLSDLKEQEKWFTKKAIWLVPIAGWAAQMMESMGNYRAARNFTYFQNHFENMNIDEQRNAWEKWVQHPLFGTAEFHDARYDLDMGEQVTKRLYDGSAPIPQLINTARRLSDTAGEEAGIDIREP